MSGFVIEPAFLGHWRFEEAGAAAKLLWVTCGVWAADEENGGFVPLAIVKLYGRVAEARRLVAVALWEEVEGGYRFLRWRDGKSTPESQDEERRRLAADRARRYREKQRASRTSVTNVTLRHVTERDASRDASRDAKVGLDTTLLQEVPPLTPPPGGGAAPRSAPPRSRPTRMTEKFEITATMRAWAKVHVPGLDVDAATADFVDFWIGEGKAKADWTATWRNGMKSRDEKGRFRGGKPKIDPQQEWKMR